MTNLFTHAAKCTVTGYIAGRYGSDVRAAEECARMNEGLPLHNFVVVGL